MKIPFSPFKILLISALLLTSCGKVNDISIAAGTDQSGTPSTSSQNSAQPGTSSTPSTSSQNSSNGSQDPSAQQTPSSLEAGTRILHARATVASDSCGERIASVDQQFVLTVGASGSTIDTSLVTVPATITSDTATAKYSASSSGCTRVYSIKLDAISSASPTASLSMQSSCGGRTCKSTWEGPVSKDNSLRDLSDPAELRASEAVCNPNVPQGVHYRPSLLECSGNAAVLMSGSQRKNYSIVLRRNGSQNDRDPKNPSCSDAQCSPYKTQYKFELPAYQVNCLGDNGFSYYFTLPNRISIKYLAQITDVNDPSQFEQYCLNNRKVNLH